MNPSLPPRRTLSRPLPTARQDTVYAISHHLDMMTSRINRMTESQQRILRALQSQAPEGVSRLEWLARQLNGQ